VLGCIYFQQHQYDKAIKLFREAEQLGGANPRYLYHQGMVYRKKGDSVRAKKVLDRAIRASGNNKTLLREHIEKME